jgi:transcriptional regulator with XRE-family HTH domain
VNGDYFPGRLRELREAAGLTQTELAEQVGVLRSAVARWERGIREPGQEMCLASSRAF